MTSLRREVKKRLRLPLVCRLRPLRQGRRHMLRSGRVFQVETSWTYALLVCRWSSSTYGWRLDISEPLLWIYSCILNVLEMISGMLACVR